MSDSTHGLALFLFEIALTGKGQLRIHQGPARRLKVDVIKAGTALGKGKHRHPLMV